ncbi:MAG: DUF6314 family protein [Pseudomonadota bacterium]
MAERVLADFAGRWRLSRAIAPVGQPEAQFEGVAEWVPDAEGRLAYAESGLLRVPGQAEMRAERRYTWDAELNVWFEDGRFFHTVPAAGGKAEHWCDPDWYHVDYRFGSWPVFEVEWRVSGPRKDYVSVSRYARAG